MQVGTGIAAFTALGVVLALVVIFGFVRETKGVVLARVAADAPAP